MTQLLSEEEIAEFREIFNLVDRDGGGSITKEELGELMDTLGIDASPEEIDIMIREVTLGNILTMLSMYEVLLFFFVKIDQDGNGDIDFEEFVAVMSRKVNATYTAQQVKSAFKVFEGQCPLGHVRADALVRYVNQLPLIAMLTTANAFSFRALTTYGTEKLSLEQATDLVAQLEVDANGLINYNDYVNMMMMST